MGRIWVRKCIFFLTIVKFFNIIVFVRKFMVLFITWKFMFEA